MAKKLKAVEWLERLFDAGLSRKEVAQATGYSTSTIGRIARGQSSGEAQREAFRDVAQLGKRAQAAVVAGERVIEHRKAAPVAAPPAAPEAKAAPAVRLLDPFEKAQGEISFLARGGVERVMVHITSKSTGRSRTLYAKGGIDPSQISGNLKRSLNAQAKLQGSQGNVKSKSDPVIDWDDVEISFEEWY